MPSTSQNFWPNTKTYIYIRPVGKEDTESERVPNPHSRKGLGLALAFQGSKYLTVHKRNPLGHAATS